MKKVYFAMHRSVEDYAKRLIKLPRRNRVRYQEDKLYKVEWTEELKDKTEILKNLKELDKKLEKYNEVNPI